MPVADLLPDEIGAWRMRIPEGHRHDATQAFRQVLNAAVKWRVLPENPAKLVRNPLPKREEIRPFETWAGVDAVADELGPTTGAIAVFAAATELRPEEWLALEWRNVDLRERAVTVRRAYSSGCLRDWGEDRSLPETRAAASEGRGRARKASPTPWTLGSCSRRSGAAT